MPLVTVKAIEGVFSPDQKRQLVERITEVISSLEGVPPRATWVIIEEVRSGDWGVGGRLIASADVRATTV